MTKKRLITAGIITIITAALIAAVIFRLIIPPLFSKPCNRTVHDPAGVDIVEEKRDITVFIDGEKVWELDGNVLAQDFLFEDVDDDGEKELLILCWKRGRYGKRRPTWVKRDEIGWSQHIFIYEIKDMRVTPKWMASDIGMDAASWGFKDGMLYITDTKGTVTKWKWIHWGLEKI